MNTEKLESYISDFFKDDSRLRFDKWRYEDGCVLLAAEKLYEATGDAKFRDFILRYADSYVTSDGGIRTYRPEEYKLDDILPGRALLFAYSETGEERYMLAVKRLISQLENQPRTPSKNYWHKKIYPNQVWLDGLFMAMPFRMEYETKYGKKDGYPDICDQFLRVRQNMRDPASGLYYHGFDESRSVFWADRVSGCSRNFWLRAIGWYLMSLADTLEVMDRRVYDYMRPLQDVYKEALRGLLRYRDVKTGLWYQVVDKGGIEGNYLETSGSAMTAASMFKACRLKLILGEKYLPIAEKTLNSLIELKLIERDGRLVLTDTCSVAGLGPDVGRRDGSVGYYLSEPVVNDDSKGAAALFLAYSQYLLLKGFRK